MNRSSLLYRSDLFVRIGGMCAVGMFSQGDLREVYYYPEQLQRHTERSYHPGNKTMRNRPVPTRRAPTLLVGSLICATVLSGCGNVSVFGRTIGEKQPESSTSLATAHAASKVKTVSLVLTPQFVEKAALDSKFNTDTMLTAIKSELRSRNVLDDSDPNVTAFAEIVLDEYALSPTSNAIVFGQIISSGVLNGTLRVRDDKHAELSSHRIESKARVSAPAQAQAQSQWKSDNPLAPLYRQFAVLVGDALTGVPTPTRDSDAWRPR